jgi:hypothetical protein
MKLFLIYFLAGINLAKAADLETLRASAKVKSLIDDYFLPEDSVKTNLVDKSWKIIYKNLMPHKKNFKSEETIAISGNSEYRWGTSYATVGFPGIRYEITHVDPEGQFGNLGISVDSTITKINDISLSKTSIENNYEEFKLLFKRGDACTLTFKSNQFALLQHRKSKELLLKTLSNDKVYDEYVTNVQTYLEKKQWQKAYAPWYESDEPYVARFNYTLPRNLHRTLQHNLVDFIDVNEKMDINHLSDALREQDVALTKKLISRGAKVDADGVISAVYGGSAECTKLLLEANPKAVNEKERHIGTPLDYAVCAKSSIECAAMLIKFGANLKAKDKDGCTALRKAINSHKDPWYWRGTNYHVEYLPSGI